MDCRAISVMRAGTSRVSRSAMASTLAACFVLVAIPAVGQAAPAAGNQITLTYSFAAPRVEIDGVVSKVNLHGLASYGEPGKPVLPFQPVRILLPYGTEVERVRVKPGDKVELPGVHTVACGQRPAPLSRPDRIVQTPPDPVLYSSKAAFPAQLYSGRSVQYKKGFAILCLNLWPVEYVPAQGRLSCYQSLIVEVTLKPAAADKPTMLRPRGLRQDKAEIRKLVSNPEVVDTYPAEAPARKGDSAALLDPTRHYDYVVITDPAFVASFMPLVAAHADTMLTTVVTTSWIYANYSGARPSGSSDNQTRIRNFIIDAYHTWGTQYVLLGGDADGANVGGESGNNIVPCRGFLVNTGWDYDDNIPADMYYGCLDGSFDQNANGVYGEPNDGPDGGEVDLFFDVHVGRAAVDSVAEVNNFVSKTLWYMGASGDWLREVWMVSEQLGFGGPAEYGDLSKDQIKNGTTTPVQTIGFLNCPNASFFRVHDLADNRAPYSYPPGWPTSAIVNVINSGVHVINHLGHGNNTWLMKMNNPTVDGLTNSLFLIGYSQACYCGAFDNRDDSWSYLSSDCVVEHFNSGARGCAAIVANSRYGWGTYNSLDGPSQFYDRQFWDNILGEGLLELARANDKSKEDNANYISDPYMRWVFYELNLFGDPALRFRTITSRGTVALDRTYYPAPSTATVTVEDADLDLNPSGRDSVNVEIASTTEATSEIVTLFETGNQTKTFVGSIALVLGAAAPDGKLQVANGNTVKVAYHDANDGTGNPATVTDAATIDTSPPVISNVAVVDITNTSARVIWATDEMSDSRVEYGVTTPTTQSAFDGNYVTSHSVVLNALKPFTRYYYRVISTDQTSTNTSWWPATGYGQFQTHGPTLLVSPTSFTFTVYQGYSDYSTMTITNNGDTTLTWRTYEIELLAGGPLGRTIQPLGLAGLSSVHPSVGSRWNSGVALSDVSPELSLAAGPPPLDFSDIHFNYDVQTLTGDNQCVGVEFDGSRFYVSGGNSGTDPNKVHVFDAAGNYLHSFNQTNSSDWGWRDLSFDGQYLYGSDDANISQFRTDGTYIGDFPGPGLSPCRGLAYDPETDHFWTVSWSSLIYEITRTGAIVRSFPNSSSVYGLAWDNVSLDGPWLWCFCQDAPSYRVFRQFDPRLGIYTGVSFVGWAEAGSGSAGGACFTDQWDPAYGILVGLTQTAHDHIVGYEACLAGARWLDESPRSGVTSPTASQDVRVTVDSTGLTTGTYRANLFVQGQSLDSPVTVTVTMRVLPAPALAYDSYRIEDPAPGGDGDGFIEPVETANIYVRLRNAGGASATSVTGAFDFTVPGMTTVTLVNGNVSWPDIPSSATAWSTNAIVVQTSVTCPSGATFRLAGTVDVADPMFGPWPAVLPDIQVWPAWSLEGRVFDQNTSLPTAGVAVLSLTSPTASFWDDMESGKAKWTADAPWDHTTDTAHSPTTCWTDSPGGSYAPYAQVGLYSVPFSLAGVSGAQLRFWQRYDLAWDWSWWWGDSATVYVSTNGVNWNYLYDFAMTNMTWHEVVLDLSAYDGATSVQLCFYLDGWLGWSGYDGWYIDDVEVRGQPQTGPTAVTNATGAYRINGLPAGIYTVFPDAAGSGYSASSPTRHVATLPPDASGLDFRLLSPEIGVTPTSFTFTLRQGETTSSRMWIANSGSFDLQWRMEEEEVGGTGLLTRGARPGIGSWLNLPASAARQTGANARRAPTSSPPRAYEWSPGITDGGGPKILIYADDWIHTAPNTYVDQALVRLGLPYTAYYDGAFGGFEQSLAAGGPWDLVIFDDENYNPPVSSLNALDQYVAAGGKLVVWTWKMDANAAHALWTDLGVVFKANDDGPPDPVYWWQPTHRVFTYPEDVPQFTGRVDIGFPPYGQRVGVLTGPTALAGYTQVGPVADQAALVLDSTGSSFFKGFSDTDNNADLDSDGVPDPVELWENLISFSMDRVSWLSETPTKGTVATGKTTSVTVTADAEEMAVGAYRARLLVTSNDRDEPVTTVPVTMNVLLGLPNIAVQPPSVNFGFVWLGYPRTQIVTVSNDGYSTLTISSLSRTNSDYTITSAPALPIHLTRKQRANVWVQFAPDSVGLSTGTLTVTSNDPGSGMLVVPLSGIGVGAPVVRVTPSLLTTVTLYQDQTTTRLLTIHNDGESTLTVQMIRDEETAPPRLGSLSARRGRGPIPPKPGEIPVGAEYVPEQVLVKYRPQAAVLAQALDAQLGAQEIRSYPAIGVRLMKLGRGVSVADAVRQYVNSGLVEYAEPNYRRHLHVIPNDPFFNELWGMHNTGQTSGTVDADIDAPEAWDVATGSSDIVIGGIDTGITYTHPDLAGNIWTNPGEIPGNDIDDDHNGYVDDVHGYDFVNRDGDPMDDNGHGSHTAGTMGAVGNNAVGVVGVCWRVKFAALKAFDASGWAADADLLEALLYANRMGFKLTNNSWGGGPYSASFKAAIDAAGAMGALFIASAGNDGVDTDLFPQYPACYDSPNIISVLATDHNDQLAYVAGWWGSNWGRTTVDLGAPGLYIYSTVLGAAYDTYSGTSMAAPHVTGAAALLWSYVPRVTSTTIKAAILDSAQPVPGLASKCLTGGRLNLPNALRLAQLYTGAPWLWEQPPQPVPIQIPAARSVDVVVHYDARIPQAIPAPGAFFGQVIVASDDPVTSEVAVNASMEVLPISRLEYASQVLDDDTTAPSSGDGDGHAESGETIEVWLDLINSGCLTAQDVAGTFTLVAGTSVTLINGNVTWPKIPAGQTKTSSQALVVSIAPSCPEGTTIVLQGLVDDSNPLFGPWLVTLTTITVQRVYTVSGVVRDANTSQGVAGVIVRAERRVIPFADDMESGKAKWTADAPWDHTTAASHSPVTCWTDSPGGNYNNDTYAGIYTVPFSLAGVTGAQLRFWHRYDLEHGYDFGEVYASTDGLNWDWLAGFTGTDLTWREVTLDLSAYAGEPSVQICFFLSADFMITADGWYIDDVTVESVSGLGAAVCGTNGVFRFTGLTSGTCTLLPDVARSGYSASSPTVRTLTVPPDVSDADFLLLSPEINATPTSFTFSVKEDATTPTAQDTLWISNAGSYALQWSLKEESVEGILGTPRDRTGVGSWLNVADSIDRNAAANAPRASSSSKPCGYKWSPGVTAGGGPKILIYADDWVHTAPNTYVDQALVRLGLSYMAYYDGAFGAFEQSLATGGPWDLVIFLAENWGPPTSTLNALNQYAAAGGNLVAYTWWMSNAAAHPLWATLGVAYVSNDGEPPDPVYWWDPTNPIFTAPESVPEFTTLTGGIYGVYGQHVSVLAGATAIAGHTAGGPAPNEAAMVLGSTGKTLFRGFGDGQNSADLDTDGVRDGVELWENIVSFLSDRVPWLAEAPGRGTLATGGTTSVTVSVDAKDMAMGTYRANLLLAANDRDEPVTTIPVTLKVVPGDPDIDATPTAVNFGQVFVGAPETRSVTVSNVGYGILSVTTLDIAGGASWSIDSPTSGQLPVNLTRGHSASIVVRFSPSAPGPSTGTLGIHSNSLGEPLVTIPLSGEGLGRPQIVVATIPRADVAFGGQTTGVLHIENVGQGGLIVSAVTKRYVTPFGGLGLSEPPRNIEIIKNDTLNTDAPSGPAILSTFAGSHLSFAISNYGEIMPFQYPVGTEHLAVGGRLEGYVICYQDTSGDHVAWANFGSRNHLRPVSYEEIENSTTQTVVKVVTQTTDDKLEITHLATFNKIGKAIAVRVSVDNVSTETLGQVVYKRVSDWDVDNTPTTDTFAFDSQTSMAYAYETHYVGITADRAPAYRDLDGWDDHERRLTDEDQPNGPVMMDGLTVLHYELGSLAPDVEADLQLAFVAGNSLNELRAGIRSVFGWLTVTPEELPLEIDPGTSCNVSLLYDARGLALGDYQAELRVYSNDPYSTGVMRIAALRVSDPTSPTAPGTPVPDIAPYTSRTTVVYTWGAATDPESGIQGYWCQVGTVPGGNNVFDGFTTETTKSVVGQDGQTLYCRVRAINGQSMNGPWSGVSEPTTIDISSPSQPGVPQDPGVYTSQTLVTFNWAAATDGTSGSGVASYDLQVGAAPGASDRFDGNVGNVLTRAVTGLNGQQLYARVRARDQAGNVGQWSGDSDGILIDTIAPGQPGPVTDTGAYTSSTSVVFSWTAAADLGTTPSGIASYDLQVGTAPGASNVFNQNVGNVLTKAVPGANGQTLYARVRARDNAGNMGPWSLVSDGILVDTAAPTAPGRPADAGAYTSSTLVRFDWTVATDTGSGVASYDLQVGTTPGGSDRFNANVGNVLTQTVPGSNGQTLYARVRARDRTGNVGPWSLVSDGILIDTAAPTAPGRPTDIGAYTSSTLVRFNWTAAADTGSGVASYDLQVGTTPGGSDRFNANVGNVLTQTVPGSNGQTLYARVRARDNAGNVGPWSLVSDGILIDTAAPTAPGRPTDIGAYTSSTLVRFNWTAAADTGSGIASYDLQVGTTPGGDDRFNASVGNIRTKTVRGLNGQTLYARARARDGAGNMGPWSLVSDGILIDTARPTTPATPTDAGAFTSSTSVRFDWTAASDTGSGVASYDLQVGTSPGASDRFNANIGNVLTRTVTGANGQTLYARVRARDRAGNTGLWSGNSDGITVDTVRPRLTDVVARDYLTLDITFSEQMKNADSPSNYSCSGGISIVGVMQLNDTQYRLYTSTQITGRSYTLTVGTAVTDRAGNGIDGSYRSRSFTGGIVTAARSWELYR